MNPELQMCEPRIMNVQIQNYQCENPELLASLDQHIENYCADPQFLKCRFRIAKVAVVQIQNYFCMNPELMMYRSIVAKVTIECGFAFIPAI